MVWIIMIIFESQIKRYSSMRKLFLRILFLTLPFAFSACVLFDDQSTPYGYVKSSFRKIDKYALNACDAIIERLNIKDE